MNAIETLFAKRIVNDENFTLENVPESLKTEVSRILTEEFEKSELAV